MKPSKVQKLCFFPYTIFHPKAFIEKRSISRVAKQPGFQLRYSSAFTLSLFLTRSLTLSHSPFILLGFVCCVGNAFEEDLLWRRQRLPPYLASSTSTSTSSSSSERSLEKTHRQRRALTPWPHRKLGSSLCQPGHTKTLWQRWALQCGPLTQKTPFDEN